MRRLTKEESEALSIDALAWISVGGFELSHDAARVPVDFLGCDFLGSTLDSQGRPLVTPMYGRVYLLENQGQGWNVTEVRTTWIS